MKRFSNKNQILLKCKKFIIFAIFLFLLQPSVTINFPIFNAFERIDSLDVRPFIDIRSIKNNSFISTFSVNLSFLPIYAFSFKNIWTFLSDTYYYCKNIIFVNRFYYEDLITINDIKLNNRTRKYSTKIIQNFIFNIVMYFE